MVDVLLHQNLIFFRSVETGLGRWILVVAVISVYPCHFLVFSDLTCYLKACVCYFLSSFYFSPNDSPLQAMKSALYLIQKALFVLEIFKFLYYCLLLFFLLSTIAWEVDPRKILKFMMSSAVSVRINDTFCLISWEWNKVWHWNFVH